MTPEEFDVKYEPYLEEGNYGLEIDDPEIIDYLDKVFTIEVEKNKDFKYSQIKKKYGRVCIYTNTWSSYEWEVDLNKT